jgi:hypothetical protein
MFLQIHIKDRHPMLTFDESLHAAQIRVQIVHTP